jgi:hypothetical protein
MLDEGLERSLLVKKCSHIIKTTGERTKTAIIRVLSQMLFLERNLAFCAQPPTQKLQRPMSL